MFSGSWTAWSIWWESEQLGQAKRLDLLITHSDLQKARAELMRFGLKEEGRKLAKGTNYLCQAADAESESQQKPQGRGEPGE